MTKQLLSHQALAHRCLSQMMRQSRLNEDKTPFYCLTDHADADFSQLVRDIHGDNLPDDYTFQFIHDALECIADNDDIDDCVLISNAWSNHDQCLWLISRNDRREYVDTAILQADKKLPIGFALEYAIDTEMNEVLAEVIAFIINKLKEV